MKTSHRRVLRLLGEAGWLEWPSGAAAWARAYPKHWRLYDSEGRIVAYVRDTTAVAMCSLGLLAEYNGTLRVARGGASI
jgi:hypothetical protein